jgi:hypothetical protein
MLRVRTLAERALQVSRWRGGRSCTAPGAE